MSEQFAKINPFKLVPVIDDSGFILTERYIHFIKKPAIFIFIFIYPPIPLHQILIYPSIYYLLIFHLPIFSNLCILPSIYHFSICVPFFYFLMCHPYSIYPFTPT